MEKKNIEYYPFACRIIKWKFLAEILSVFDFKTLQTNPYNEVHPFLQKKQRGNYINVEILS